MKCVCLKVKFSLYIPEQALGDPEGQSFRIFPTFGPMKVVRSSPLVRECKEEKNVGVKEYDARN